MDAVMGSVARKDTGSIKEIMGRWNRISLAFEEQRKIDTMSPRELEKMKQELESAPEYAAYQKEPVTLATLRSIVEDFDAQAERVSQDPELARRLPVMRKKLVADLFGIEDKINRYVANLKKSEQEKMQFVQDGIVIDQDSKEDMAESVRIRNDSHNAVINELKSLHGFILRDTDIDDEDVGKGKAIGLRSIGIEIPQEKLLPVDMLDTSRDKRDAVERWATTNYFGSRVEAVLARMRQREGGEKAVA